MQILIAVDAQDFRRGIDGLARVCREVLQSDPLGGTLFVFRNRRGTAIKCLVYTQRDPGVLIRLVGQAPITACVYALEKLRCNLCGEVFTADPAPGIGLEKYDPTTGAMIALLK